jgi:hypothetical protein
MGASVFTPELAAPPARRASGGKGAGPERSAEHHGQSLSSFRRADGGARVEGRLADHPSGPSLFNVLAKRRTTNPVPLDGKQFPCMNRKPGETAEQWNARAAAEYQESLAIVDVESKRPGLDSWRFPPGTYPTLDEAYDAAMDNVDAADDELTDASNALHLEGPPTIPGEGQADT